MTNKRLLFISQEIAPYIPANPLSSIGKNLPVKMQEKGFEVRTFMPKFGTVNERRNQLHEVIRLSGINIMINDNDHPLIIKVASLQPARIQVYFIDNEDFFQKLASDVDASGSNREDNDERAIFFARGALETAKKLRWDPKIVNCSGWISSLVPLYLNKFYTDDISFKSSMPVYVITPGLTPGKVDPDIFHKLKEDGFSDEDLKEIESIPLDENFFHKVGIINSKGVIVSDAEINKDLMDFIKERNLPLLVVEGPEVNPEIYGEFYNSL